MHRDIKPHNILIDGETNEVYIIDWGLADYYKPSVLSVCFLIRRHETGCASEYAQLQGTRVAYK